MLRAAARPRDPLELGRPIARRYRATVDVVSAAVIRRGLVLAARRITPPGWEFPGGKIDPGERPQQALVRECREELGIEVDCLGRLGVAGDERIRLQLWQVALRSGTPMPLVDHDALQWVDGEALGTLDWLPLDRALLDVVRHALG